MAAVRFQYIFDPLCGWCYASSPALAELAERWPEQVDMLPSGLFSGTGARPLPADFAAYPWSNDQRNAAATGEVFSPAYRDNVLTDSSQLFDSTAINRALTAVQQISDALQPRLLRQLQLARYVEGENTSSAQVVAALTNRALQDMGHTVDAGELAQRLETSDELAAQTEARIGATQRLMSRFGVRGVLQLLVQVDEQTHALVCPLSGP